MRGSRRAAQSRQSPSLIKVDPEPSNGLSPQHYFPGIHPEDPSRDEFEVPRAAWDPARDTNQDEASPRQGPAWDNYARMAPEARPQDSEDFLLHSGTVAINASTRALALKFSIPEGYEGRLLAWGAQSVSTADLAARNLGFDLSWELLINGSTRPRISKVSGVFSSIERPKDLCINLPRGAVVEIYCTTPAGVARQVQTLIHGWLAPILRGQGRVSAGHMKI